VLKPFIAAVADGIHLDRQRAAEAMQIIMSGEATAAQIGGFLMALRAKGETVDELVGFAGVMRAHVVGLDHPPTDAIDTCGTGGDGKHTLNISTAAAITAAAAGAVVAKHGNRSVSSKCGSADLLEQWGVRIDLPPEKAAAAMHEHNITFMFAPHYHPAMKHAAGPRREMGVRTVFNLLGPMTNPARVRRQVLGVFDPRWTEPLATALLDLGSEHVLVVASDDGLDEISPAAPTRISEGRNGRVETYTVSPGVLGSESCDLRAITGGAADENAARLEQILQGHGGIAAIAVALNAGAALYVANRAESLREGVAVAARTLASGRPWEKLTRWAEWTQKQASN